MSDDLAARAEDLRDEVKRLRLAVEQLGVRTARTERATSRIALGAVAMLVLVGVMGWLIWAQAATSDRLESITQRSLCPVFALVVGGADPSTRQAGPGRDKYVAAITVMRGAYTELRCSSPLVPPRTGN